MAVEHRAYSQCGATEAGTCCEAKTTPFCDDSKCCTTVCASDPWCCSVMWDQVCADLAWKLCPDLQGCGECGSSTAGDCCAANNTRFCNDAACCAVVCDEDRYCCEFAWDECCVNLAVENCADLEGCHVPPLESPPPWIVPPPPPPHPACGPDAGDCFGPGGNGIPGCNDLDCCASVCFCDPFCCEIQWDHSCYNPGPDFKCLCGPGQCGAVNRCGTALPPAFSCQGNCGGTAPSGCWCDEACCDFDDCCIDKAYKCLGCTPAEEDAIPVSVYSTCLDACSDEPGTGGGGCSCDDGCCERGDCCPDKADHCAGCAPQPRNPADLTGNNVVDVFDVLALLTNWGDCQFERCFVMEACPGDFNHDGVVDVFDLLFLLANWG